MIYIMLEQIQLRQTTTNKSHLKQLCHHSLIPHVIKTQMFVCLFVYFLNFCILELNILNTLYGKAFFKMSSFFPTEVSKPFGFKTTWIWVNDDRPSSVHRSQLLSRRRAESTYDWKSRIFPCSKLSCKLMKKCSHSVLWWQWLWQGEMRHWIRLWMATLAVQHSQANVDQGMQLSQEPGNNMLAHCTSELKSCDSDHRIGCDLIAEQIKALLLQWKATLFHSITNSADRAVNF